MPDTGSFKALARARARSLTQWPLLIVIGVLVVGLVLVMMGHWRRGTAVIGGGLCVGAAERSFLPDQVAGLLKVRGRAFDVTCLLGSGVAIMVLAVAVPAP